MTELKDISTRSDVAHLVRTFYGKVRTHPTLSGIFNFMLTSDEVWEHHFEKLTDFWSDNLLGSRAYDGNLIHQHIWVDSQTSRRISIRHFESWLGLWRDSVKENFKGIVANRAITRAESMAERINERILDVRNQIARG